MANPYSPILYPYWWDAINSLDPSIPTNANFSMLGIFLINAGNLTENCSIALSWYRQSHLAWAEGASFGYGNETINIEFMQLAAPNLIVNLTDSEISFWYDLLANVTYPVGDAVLNITRPAIELYCIPTLLAEVESVSWTQNCTTELDNYGYPGFEDSDAFGDALAVFANLSAEYQNMSIQVFWGWYNLVGGLTPDEIYAQKKICFQEVCGQLDSGNPDVVGIGVRS
jgi:hypothetical protein